MVEDKPASGSAINDIAEIEALLAEARRKAAAVADPAALAYAARRRRDTLFGDNAELFGEPAWDILLDLYSARLRGQIVSVSSACVAAQVPATTALRYLKILEDRGLVERKPDPHDRRSVQVALSDAGMGQMRLCLEAMPR